jgi:Tfp pilus assembly protein PilF
VVRQALLLPRLNAKFGAESTWLALAVAIVWGVHPLGTQAVTYIVQRAESMVALFYLVTLYCVIRGERATRRLHWFILAVTSCAAGMATKEVMATAPLVVLLFERVFVFNSWRQTFRERWRLFVGLAATWPLLAALIIAAGGRGGSVGFEAAITPWQYLLTQCVAIVRYVRLSISPSPLIFDYGAEPVTDPRQVVPCAIILVILLSAAIVALRYAPAIGFLGISFFLILAPSSSVVPIVTQAISEHRMYLPLATIVTLVVIGFHVGWRRLRDRRHLGGDHGWMRVGPAAMLSLVVVILGLQTWLRNVDYRTSIQIWADTVAKRPSNARAYSNLGQQYFRAGYMDAAMQVFQQGIERMPHSHALYYNRGTIYLRAGEFAEADADLSRAIELKGDFVEAYQNRGVARRRLERYEEAVADFTTSLELLSDQTLAYKNRALAYHALRQYDKARADADRFLELGGQPDHELLKILNDVIAFPSSTIP